MLIEKIKEQIMNWEGVTSGVHRFGGIEFRIGYREMGHVHVDKLADLPFPMQIRNKLVESGHASPHHILPHSGWVSMWINGEDDVAGVIELFRMQYERLKPHDKQNDVL